MRKPAKCHVLLAKFQISLGIRPVWLESILCTLWVAKNSMPPLADSEDSDQTGWMPRLIRLGGCPGWSESLLRAKVLLLVLSCCGSYLDRVKRIWYLSPMRAAKVQASLRIRAVSPELSLLAHTSSESRRTFRQKARSLALLNGWACAVKVCHDGMLEDKNSLDGAHLISFGFLSHALLLHSLCPFKCHLLHQYPLLT